MDRLSKILLYVIGGLLILASFLTLRTCTQSDKIAEQSSVINSLNDTVKVWKDKDGLSHTSNSVISTQDPDDFLAMENLSEENKKLQAEVKLYKSKIKNGGNVTNFTSNTEVSSTTPTKVDTVIIDNTKQLIYSSEFNKEGWVMGDVVAKPDSITVNVKTKDEYTVVVGFEKTGFLGLGKQIPFSEVKNHNPYSTTPTLKTYQVDVRKGNTWIVPTTIATVVAVIGTLLLTN